MIDSIKISNFRCFSEVEIDNIKPITIISGKNNVGKSSVLEAVFFMYDHASGAPFLKMNKVRGEIGNRSAQNTWESVFHNMDIDNPISIEMDISKIRHVLRYEKEPTSVLDFSKSNLGSLQTLNLLNNLSPYALKMTYEKEDYIEEADYVFVSGAEQSQLANDVIANCNGELVSREEMNELTYLTNDMLRDEIQLVDLLSDLERRNQKDKLVRILKIMDEDVTDVNVLTTNGIVQIYVKKNDLSIPIRYSGDGMMKLTDIVLRILTSPNSVLLIDEIENGLHFSMYEQLWNIIANTAKETNCQILVTTHSYECISSSLQGIEAAGRMDDFSYIRLEKNNGIIEPQQYSYSEMKNALMAEVEVR